MIIINFTFTIFCSWFRLNVGFILLVLNGVQVCRFYPIDIGTDHVHLLHMEIVVHLFLQAINQVLYFALSAVDINKDLKFRFVLQGFSRFDMDN